MRNFFQDVDQPPVPHLMPWQHALSLMSTAGAAPWLRGVGGSNGRRERWERARAGVQQQQGGRLTFLGGCALVCAEGVPRVRSVAWKVSYSRWDSGLLFKAKQTEHCTYTCGCTHANTESEIL